MLQFVLSKIVRSQWVKRDSLRQSQDVLVLLKCKIFQQADVTIIFEEYEERHGHFMERQGYHCSLAKTRGATQ